MQATDSRPAPLAATSDWALTVSDVAARLGVGGMTVRRWADRGVLPCRREHGRNNDQRRFRPCDVEALLAEAARMPVAA